VKIGPGMVGLREGACEGEGQMGLSGSSRSTDIGSRLRAGNTVAFSALVWATVTNHPHLLGTDELPGTRNSQG
jgi:hypothetical protein